MVGSGGCFWAVSVGEVAEARGWVEWSKGAGLPP